MFKTSPEDERLVAAAMNQLAHASSSSNRPDPSFIWWKAQLLRRLEAERQATAPIDVGERFHIGAAFIGLVALLAGVWDHIPAMVFSATSAFALAFGVVILLSVVAVATWDVLRH